MTPRPKAAPLLFISGFLLATCFQAQAQKVKEKCADDMHEWSIVSCGMMPKYCAEPCFGPSPEYKRYQACLDKNQEARKHNSEVKRCVGSGTTNDVPKRQHRRNADTPPGDDITAKLKRAKMKSEDAQAKNAETLRTPYRKKTEEQLEIETEREKVRAEQARIDAQREKVRQQLEAERQAREYIPAGWTPCKCPGEHQHYGKWVRGILYHPNSVYYCN